MLKCNEQNAIRYRKHWGVSQVYLSIPPGSLSCEPWLQWKNILPGNEARRNISSLQGESTPLQSPLPLLLHCPILGQQKFSYFTYYAKKKKPSQLCPSKDNSGWIYTVGKMHYVAQHKALAASWEHFGVKLLSRGQMKQAGWMVEELGLHMCCVGKNLLSFRSGESVISSAVGRESKL